MGFNYGFLFLFLFFLIIIYYQKKIIYHLNHHIYFSPVIFALKILPMCSQQAWSVHKKEATRYYLNSTGKYQYSMEKIHNVHPYRQHFTGISPTCPEHWNVKLSGELLRGKIWEKQYSKNQWEERGRWQRAWTILLIHKKPEQLQTDTSQHLEPHAVLWKSCGLKFKIHGRYSDCIETFDWFSFSAFGSGFWNDFTYAWDFVILQQHNLIIQLGEEKGKRVRAHTGALISSHDVCSLMKRRRSKKGSFREKESVA